MLDILTPQEVFVEYIRELTEKTSLKRYQGLVNYYNDFITSVHRLKEPFNFKKEVPIYLEEIGDGKFIISDRDTKNRILLLKKEPIMISYIDAGLEFLNVNDTEGGIINKKNPCYSCSLFVPSTDLILQYSNPIKNQQILDFINS